MEQPVYVRRLLEQKYLLIVGFVVAVIAGLLAGFTIQNGEVLSRAVKSYSASSTVLLSSPVPSVYQVQIPAVTEPVPAEGEAQELIVTQSAPVDLSDSAIILAYMASSDQIADTVASEVGGLADGEAITAVRRTTQPSGDERFGGRLSLPIIDIIAVAESPTRAELIAAKATTAFDELVKAQQVEWGVAEDIRLTLVELNAPVADEGEGSNPAIPIVIVAVGVFLLFIAVALIIGAIRDRQRAKHTAAGGDESDADEGSGEAEDDGAADDETLAQSEVRSSRRARASESRDADSAGESSDEPATYSPS